MRVRRESFSLIPSDVATYVISCNSAPRVAPLLFSALANEYDILRCGIRSPTQTLVESLHVGRGAQKTDEKCVGRRDAHPEEDATTLAPGCSFIIRTSGPGRLPSHSMLHPGVWPTHAMTHHIWHSHLLLEVRFVVRAS